MKILGWDIGIKNLSYCILEYNGSKKQNLEEVYNESKIIDWGIIDLRDETENIESKKDTQSKNKKDTQSKKEKDTQYKNKKDTQSKKEKDKKAPKKTKCKDIKLIDIGKTINKSFSDKLSFKDIEYVVIENQPVLKNPTMKSIQMMVFSYFVFSNQNIEDVCLLNASNKMKVYKNNIDITLLEKVTKLKSKYSQNKKLSIIHTELLLNETKQDNVYIDLFSKSKKKDDLADSYLMSLFFIANRINKVPKKTGTKC